MKYYLSGAFVGALCFLLFLGVLFYFQLNLSLALASGKLFLIEPGQTLKDIALNLEEEHIITDARPLYLYTSLLGKDTGLQAGVYRLLPTMKVRDLLALFQGGTNVSLDVTIPEGFTLDKILARFTEAGFEVSGRDFIVTSTLKREYSFLGDVPTGSTLEGFLFPETYTFSAGASGDDIRTTLLNTFQERFNPRWYAIIQEQGRTVLDIVTMASILEKELPNLRDKKIGAGLLWRRILVGMPLQVDATVNYATGKSLPAVTFEDLEVESPYNTYKHTGLPPGPISNPGLESIEAAIFPEDSPYWFYLSRQDTGETIFSQTYEQHLAAKAKYLQ